MTTRQPHQLCFFEEVHYYITSNKVTPREMTPYYDTALSIAKEQLKQCCIKHYEELKEFYCDINTRDTTPTAPKITLLVIEGGQIIGKKYFE